MGQAKRRATEILELKKIKKYQEIKEYQECMGINLDCSKWFYEDGHIFGIVSIKNSNHSFNYSLEVVHCVNNEYHFGSTLDIYSFNDEVKKIGDEEFKLNDEVKFFLQDLLNKDDFLKELKENLMKILPIKDFRNEIEDDSEEYDYSDEEVAEMERLEEIYGEKPIENPVVCDGCNGSGYHYLVTLEEYKENPNIELGGDIRCYKCGGDGEHEKGFEGYVTGGKIYVPYKK